MLTILFKSVDGEEVYSVISVNFKKGRFAKGEEIFHVDSPHGPEYSKSIFFKSLCTAYVMNEQGQTVHKVRFVPKAE